MLQSASEHETGIDRWMAARLRSELPSLKDALIVGLWLVAIVLALVGARFAPPEYCDQLPPGRSGRVPCFDR